jgi:cytosine/adenosine deaminase-related metal-dependent hydrolase
MPGMIDTHRHMWQTAMRGYGADWTLTQYFVWYYLEHGKKFRPEDIAAGNRLAAIESLEAGVTTTVDWSHNLHTIDHGEAALDALRSVPGWCCTASSAGRGCSSTAIRRCWPAASCSGSPPPRCSPAPRWHCSRTTAVLTRTG